jgi:hypothetical protein
VVFRLTPSHLYSMGSSGSKTKKKIQAVQAFKGQAATTNNVPNGEPSDDVGPRDLHTDPKPEQLWTNPTAAESRYVYVNKHSYGYTPGRSRDNVYLHFSAPSDGHRYVPQALDRPKYYGNTSDAGPRYVPFTPRFDPHYRPIPMETQTYKPRPFEMPEYIPKTDLSHLYSPKETTDSQYLHKPWDSERYIPPTPNEERYVPTTPNVPLYTPSRDNHAPLYVPRSHTGTSYLPSVSLGPRYLPNVSDGPRYVSSVSSGPRYVYGTSSLAHYVPSRPSDHSYIPMVR